MSLLAIQAEGLEQAQLDITSVPLTGAPVETRLPLRSVILLMPVPSTVTTCMRFG